MYYGSGNPSTWNPAQRPGDNKWSMSIWARDLDTGKVKWVYQMTPYDEWDFDGINEMILADINVKGKPTKALVHFDRNGFGYTLDRTNGALLVAQKYRPGGELGHPRRHEDRPSAGGLQVQHGAKRHGREQQGRLPGRAGVEGRAAGGVQPEDQLFYVPTNHVCMDYEPFKVSTPRASPMSGRRSRCIRPPARPTWATSSPGTARPARSSGPTRSSSRSGQARSPPPAAWCSTARWKAI